MHADPGNTGSAPNRPDWYQSTVVYANRNLLENNWIIIDINASVILPAIEYV
jgi:hypothetical protein